MDIIFIFLAKYFFVLSFLLLGIYFLKQSYEKKRNMVIFFVSSAILTFVVATVGGYLYYDPRPFVVGNFTPLVSHVADNGFPSDHILMLSFLAMVALYWNKKLGINLWVVTIIVAVARVYVGVHHPIDVMGSMVISIICALVTQKLIKYSFKS